LGCKSVAIYRDGCKQTQVLTTHKDDMVAKDIEQAEQSGYVGVEATTQAIESLLHSHPTRKRLPDERPGITHKFTIADTEGYLTVGLYANGQPGEIFIKMAKEGSTLSGFADGFATMVSLALQYGVPLEAITSKFTSSRFEPSGFTQNPDIRITSSILDYICRYLAKKFLQTDIPPVEAPPLGPVPSTPVGVTMGNTCPQCGSLLRVAGTCFSCPSCAYSTGCS